jgi:branched-chain amino acid transport system substrate-binding protein
MKVLADAIKRAGTTEGPKLKDAINSTKNFPGVTGTITIDADRNAVKPAVVLKLQDRKYIYQETVYPEGMAPTTSSSPAAAAPASSPVAENAGAGNGAAKSATPASKSSNP